MSKISERAYRDIKAGIKPTIQSYKNLFGEFHEPTIRAAIDAASARVAAEDAAAKAEAAAKRGAAMKFFSDDLRRQAADLKKDNAADLTLPDRTTAGGKAINPLFKRVRDRDDAGRVFGKSAGEALGADSGEAE